MRKVATVRRQIEDNAAPAPASFRTGAASFWPRAYTYEYPPETSQRKTRTGPLPAP